MRFVALIFMLACSAQTKTSIEENVSSSLADEDGDGYFNDEDCDDLMHRPIPVRLNCVMPLTTTVMVRSTKVCFPPFFKIAMEMASGIRM